MNMTDETFDSHSAFKKAVVVAAVSALYTANKTIITVVVNEKCVVPMELVNNGFINLNVGMEAVQDFTFGLTEMTFKARFNGQSMSCVVPYSQVIQVAEPESPNVVSLPYVEVTKGEQTNEPEKKKPSLTLVKKED
ncbi:MAG: ClpXP protease specificity-enhancing factor SspB [Balneolaceae bacterium]